MRQIEIRRRAEKDLCNTPAADGRRIASAIMALGNGLSGDIKRLTSFTPEYRLRVGDWRILFDVDREKITIES